MGAEYELRENIIKCMSLEVDRIAPSLYEMLGYRKRVAQQLNKVVLDSTEGKELLQVYNYVNGNIKLLLAL